MEALESSVLATWESRLAPLFANVPERRTRMERTIGEALVPPAARAALAAAVPSASIAAMRAHTSAWLARVFQPERFDEEAAADLIGLRAAVEGQDAFFGGFHVEGRPVEVVVTKARLHVLTLLPAKVIGDAAQIDAAKAVARALLTVSPAVLDEAWEARRMDTLVFATPQIDFARRWDETSLVVTDGVAVKLSFLKLLDRTSPPKGESADPPIDPWFPPP